jgi:hypothetical protein
MIDIFNLFYNKLVIINFHSCSRRRNFEEYNNAGAGEFYAI